MRRTVASSEWPIFTCPLLAGFACPMTSSRTGESSREADGEVQVHGPEHPAVDQACAKSPGSGGVGALPPLSRRPPDLPVASEQPPIARSSPPPTQAPPNAFIFHPASLAHAYANGGSYERIKLEERTERRDAETQRGMENGEWRIENGEPRKLSASETWPYTRRTLQLRTDD